ncbi:ATP-binding protein [Virgibacillus halodenitrificans]|uniref:ATP-binding protein n=1 Tax=Virgibacillus halodenitrificans TaxID=1482 RepID=UPI000EF479E0|nr:sensor histidine kinase [Virgibacillus halodenitrificans]
MRKISLQTKILVLIISLILFIIIAVTAINGFLESKEVEEQMGERALQAARTISFMPSVRNALQGQQPEIIVQSIADEVKKFTGAEFVVVGNSESIRVAHPDLQKIGRKMVGGDNDKALIEGKYYISKAVGSLGPSLRGKAPVFNDAGDIIGIVSVGFLVKDIKSTIASKLLTLSGISSIVLLIGVFGGILLAKDIRNDTLGLEPHQISSLYRDREAILSSVKEGIVAIDEQGRINLLNDSARKLLDLQGDLLNKKIEEVFPNTKMYEVLSTGQVMIDEEMVFNHRPVIVNRIPIYENKRVVGVVSSFRDKTELNEMINTLSEVKKYSEDLRAQTHEYTNKLYVLSGLLQLGHYDEAIELIQTESQMNVTKNRILLQQIRDRTVQAILLGKLGKASEKKIDLIIDDESYLETLPVQLSVSKLITILGNLIDNAFEAVEATLEKKVTFFTTDAGEDIIFEIADSGTGIRENMLHTIFDQGFTTKTKEDRGYGLYIVKKTITELDGQIEVLNQKNGGAIFTVFIPKQRGGLNDDSSIDS